MGRHHALKPHHLYLSSSTHPSTPLDYLRTSYASSSTLLQISSSSALSVGGRIPGFKISAAFLSSLHSNIFIEVDSTYESPLSTPDHLHSTYAETLSSPFAPTMSSAPGTNTAASDTFGFSSPLTGEEDLGNDEHNVPGADGDGIPTLGTFPADDEDSRADALHIIADSVAQQRNIASRSVIFHPVTLATFVVVAGVLQQSFYNGANTDWIKILMTFTGVVMAMLGAIRLFCGPYIFEAERVGTWRWLNQGRAPEEEEENGLRVMGQQDDILLTKFGDEVIGAIIFRGVQPITNSSSPTTSKRSRRTPSSSKQTRMVIRGWSVRQKYRQKEVGSALLEDAILSAQAKWTVDGVEFAPDHANHKRILPSLFNGPLDAFVDIAHRTLTKKVQELGLGLDKGRRRK